MNKNAMYREDFHSVQVADDCFVDLVRANTVRAVYYQRRVAQKVGDDRHDWIGVRDYLKLC